MYKLTRIIIGLIWLPLGVAGQAVTVSASLEKDSFMIGDQIHLTLNLKKNPSVNVAFPRINDSLMPGIEVLERGSIDTVSRSPQMVHLQQKLLITSFDSGVYVIPALGFLVPKDSVPDTLFTNSPVLIVNTVKVDTTKEAIMDIKAPYEEPYSFEELLPYFLGGLGLLVLILVVYYIYRKWKRKEPLFPKYVKPRVPAHVIALEALEKLKAKKLWENDQHKKYHIELSDIVRRYIEDRFVIPAMESTTGDLLCQMKESGVISDESAGLVAQILRLADVVKFARAVPLPDENDLSIRNAVKFVQGTIPVEIEKEAEEIVKKEDTEND